MGDMKLASQCSTEMTTGHVFIAVSLDGFIARRDGDIDWLENLDAENEDNGFAEMMASVDGLIMGRATFQKVLSFGEWVYEKPVVVMSRSLTQTDIPDHLKERVRLSRSTPKTLLGELDAEGWRRAYLDGGKVIQSFLSEGLIEDLWLTRAPVLIGEGLPLFGPVPHDTNLAHRDTRVFPSGLVSSKYRIVQGT